MVPKQVSDDLDEDDGFRAVLFRMVPKREIGSIKDRVCFRAVLFRMVPKPTYVDDNQDKLF